MEISDILLAGTSIFLVLFFMSLELIQGKKCFSGTLSSFVEDDLPIQGALIKKAVVDLSDGRRVMAEMSGCVLCQGRFLPGDPVRVQKIGNRFMVRIPLAGNGSCNNKKGNQ